MRARTGVSVVRVRGGVRRWRARRRRREARGRQRRARRAVLRALYRRALPHTHHHSTPEALVQLPSHPLARQRAFLPL